ncbi:MAG: hypothetical protein PVG65_00205 [Candidatus Thorarchaeota archaeon]|jgi:hypothetical protein
MARNINTRQKLKKEWEKEQENRIRQQEVRIHNDVIQRIIPLYKTDSRYYFKKIIDSSIDFQTMTTQTETFHSQYITWEIVFEQFDERLIPFITAEIVYGELEDTPEDNIKIAMPDVAKFFEIEDIADSEVLKRVTLHVSFAFGSQEVSPVTSVPYQAKLLVHFINPRNYSIR